jgi:hypothetical protein
LATRSVKDRIAWSEVIDMSIQQSGTPGSDKPTTASVEHLSDKNPEERIQHNASKLAQKGEQTLKQSESNNLFTK